MIGCLLGKGKTLLLELLKGNYLLAGSKCQGRIVQSQKKRDGRYIEVNGQIGCTQLHNDKSGEVLAVWEALNSMHPISIKIREKIWTMSNFPN